MAAPNAPSISSRISSLLLDGSAVLEGHLFDDKAVENDAGAEGSAVDLHEVELPRESGEQGGSVTGNHWLNEKMELVDLARFGQCARETEAPEQHEIAAFLRFQRSNLLGDVAGEHRCAAPAERELLFR